MYPAHYMLPTSSTAKAGWYYFLENLVYFSDSLKFPIKLDAKIRYNSKSSLATINKVKNELEINFDTPQLAITSGQSIVFYKEDLLVGGAIIK